MTFSRLALLDRPAALTLERPALPRTSSMIATNHLFLILKFMVIGQVSAGEFCQSLDGAWQFTTDPALAAEARYTPISCSR